MFFCNACVVANPGLFFQHLPSIGGNPVRGPDAEVELQQVCPVEVAEINLTV